MASTFCLDDAARNEGVAGGHRRACGGRIGITHLERDPCPAERRAMVRPGVRPGMTASLSDDPALIESDFRQRLIEHERINRGSG